MSTVKEDLIQMVHFSTHFLIANAQAIPADVRDAKHGKEGNSVTWIINHCAHFPKWIKACVEGMECDMTFGGGAPELSFDNAIAALNTATEDFCAYIQTVPDEKMTQVIQFPWAPSTVKQTLGFQEWNNTYHNGQLNYIQLLLGDTEMHM